MPDTFTMNFRPDVAEFVQSQASATNRTVSDFVETVLLQEKARLAEDDHLLAVQAVTELLHHKDHTLVRDPDETAADYAARTELFGTLLAHARHG